MATDESQSVVEQLPDENPFAEAVRSLRERGESWQDIHDQLEAVYNPVDRAAFEESFFEVPVFTARVVVWDQYSTSGKRYEEREIEAVEEDETAAEARDRISPEVLEVESIEQTDTIRVC